MMKKVYAFCEEDIESCPFRVFDFEIQKFICNFYSEYAKLIIDNNYTAQKLLVRRACGTIRRSELHQKTVSKISKERAVKMLQSIEVGDELFWMARSQMVTLLEKPKELSQSARVKCQLKNGRVEYAWANTLQKVSKGNFKGKYAIEGLNLERKTDQLKYKTQMYGFRVEIEEMGERNILIIYGDTQKEVDDYINYVLRQGLEFRFGTL